MQKHELAGRLYELRRRRQQATGLQLEELLCSADGFGLTTASPLQRAICRIADGIPLGELAKHPHVIQAVGDVSALPSGRPAEVLLLSGIRTAKSLTTAAAALRMARTCDLSQLGDGEMPRVSVLSVSVDLAQVVFRHLVGNMLARPSLSALLVEPPKADTVVVRHPSGRPVEIKVVAGARAGASLVARWSAGCVFDEAPRMVGADEGVVNLNDARSAVIGRLLPGAQIFTIGSPWAPAGPVYGMVREFWGKPSARLVVIRAPAPHMNPVWWTPERCAELKATDPDAYRTDVEAEFQDPEEALFSSVELERSLRKAPLELAPVRGADYAAAMDPATRSNAWTLVIATRVAGKRVIALARQWQGSKAAPLKAREVLAEIAQICRRYGVEGVETDQYAADPLRELADEFDLGLVERAATATLNVDMYLSLRRRFSDGEIEIPDEPQLLADLRAVRKRVTQAGVAIVLPKTSDGRHCDYAPSVVRALRRWLDEPAREKPKPTAQEAAEQMARELEEAAERSLDQEARDW